MITKRLGIIITLSVVVCLFIIIFATSSRWQTIKDRSEIVCKYLSGGEFFHPGFHSWYYTRCVHRASDAGNRCRDSKECAGYCEGYPPITDPEKPGLCSRYEELRSDPCNSPEVKNGILDYTGVGHCLD